MVHGPPTCWRKRFSRTRDRIPLSMSMYLAACFRSMGTSTGASVAWRRVNVVSSSSVVGRLVRFAGTSRPQLPSVRVLGARARCPYIMHDGRRCSYVLLVWRMWDGLSGLVCLPSPHTYRSPPVSVLFCACSLLQSVPCSLLTCACPRLCAMCRCVVRGCIVWMLVCNGPVWRGAYIRYSAAGAVCVGGVCCMGLYYRTARWHVRHCYRDVVTS